MHCLRRRHEPVVNSGNLQRLQRNFVTSQKTCYISANSERKASSICPDRLPKFMEMLGLRRTRKPFPPAFWRLPHEERNCGSGVTWFLDNGSVCFRPVDSTDSSGNYWPGH